MQTSLKDIHADQSVTSTTIQMLLEVLYNPKQFEMRGFQCMVCVSIIHFESFQNAIKSNQGSICTPSSSNLHCKSCYAVTENSQLLPVRLGRATKNSGVSRVITRRIEQSCSCK